MAKYKKQEIHMIDMSNRLKMKIIHEEFTLEDEIKWEQEMEEMNNKIGQRMLRYEQEIKDLFLSTSGNSIVRNIEKNDDYFIKTYSDKFIGRNPDNIKNRLELYNKYLKEQD